jgi:hypothetical protein
MSSIVCPDCGCKNLDLIPAGMRVARGVSINSGVEHCRASINCRDCEWYTCF